LSKLSANQLEKIVHQFQYAVEMLLGRHGKEIAEKQIELRRLADIAIDIYAMTAVLGRL
jgi:acyl-CoA dehydrogenase family protein 9